MPRTPKAYPELDAVRDLMGTIPDADIAEKVGTSAAKVGRYRRKHGIKAYDGYKFGIRDAEEAAASGTAREAASKPRRSKSKGKKAAKAAPKAAKAAKAAPKTKKAAKVAPKAKKAVKVESKPKGKPGRKSKIEPFRARVGKVPDREVAALAGVTPEAVRMFRQRNDIALEVVRAPAVRSAAPAAPRKRKSKLDPYQDLLGKVPDAEVAAMAGVSSENVRAYRKRHSIDAEWRKPGAKAATPKAATPRAAQRKAAAPTVAGQQAFAVIVEGKDDVFIVLASDFVSAANEAAGRVGKARILSLEHVGAVL